MFSCWFMVGLFCLRFLARGIVVKQVWTLLIWHSGKTSVFFCLILFRGQICSRESHRSHLFYNYGVSCHYSSFSRGGVCVECALCLPLSPASLCYGILMSGCCARRGRLFSVSIIVVWQYAFCLFSSGLSFCQTTMCRYFSYSALMTLSRWSTVSSSRSAFSMSISRGALSTAFAVSRPRPFIASITHGSTSSANSSR